MFEVGKSYKHKDGFEVYKCLAVHKNKGWLQIGIHSPITLPWSKRWYEYHEPVVIKERRHVLLDGNDVYLPTQKSSYGTVIGEMEVIITDGKLTDVRIV